MKKLFVIIMLFAVACNGKGCDCVSELGAEGQSCYPNNTCDKSLICIKVSRGLGAGKTNPDTLCVNKDLVAW